MGVWERVAVGLVAEGVLSVNAEGHIYRHKIMSHGTWRTLRQPRRIDHGKRYLSIKIQMDGKVRNVKAHRLVWHVANGPIPNGLQINHINLDKQDNRLTNLELVTASQNIRHSYDNGRTIPWSNTNEWRGKPKITESQRVEIRRRRAQGATLKQIAADYAISTSHTHRIVTARKKVE